MHDPFDNIDIDVVTIVFDKETGMVSIDYDETQLNNVYVYGIIGTAFDMQKELLQHGEEDED